MIRPVQRVQSQESGDQGFWAEGAPTIDGKAYREQLVKAGAIKPLGHGQPYLPLCGPYAPSSGR